MFGISTFRLYSYAAILLVIAGLCVAVKVLNSRLDHAKATNAELVTERDQAKADYAAYKQAAEQDLALNRKTREVLQTRLTAIERSSHPVSVRCYAASVPSTAAASGASGGADAAAVNGSPATPLRDVGVALDAARIEALKNNALHLGLEEWERARR